MAIKSLYVGFQPMAKLCREDYNGNRDFFKEVNSNEKINNFISAIILIVFLLLSGIISEPLAYGYNYLNNIDYRTGCPYDYSFNITIETCTNKLNEVAYRSVCYDDLSPGPGSCWAFGFMVLCIIMIFMSIFIATLVGICSGIKMFYNIKKISDDLDNELKEIRVSKEY